MTTAEAYLAQIQNLIINVKLLLFPPLQSSDLLSYTPIHCTVNTQAPACYTNTTLSYRDEILCNIQLDSLKFMLQV